MISFGTALLAAIVTMTGSDPGGQTSFSSGTRWSNKQVPSAENDYVVQNSYVLRTPDSVAKSVTTSKFGGRSLTFGDENTGGFLAVKLYSKTRGLARTEIGDMRLAHPSSYINMACNDSSAMSPSYVSLYGKITFLCPRASVSDLNVPYIAGDMSRRLDIYSELVAAPGCGFKVTRGGDNDRFMLVSLMGDNPDFHGSISVVGPERNTGTGLTLTAESSVALGPNPETPTPLLHLCEGGTFGVEYGSVTIDQPNRGILLTTASGGRLYAAAGKTLDTSMFITSESPLRPLVKYGAGDVFVSGACSVGDVTVTEGRLGLSGEVDSSVTVNAGCSFGPALPSSKLSLSGVLTLSDAAKLRFRAGGTSGGVVELKEGFASSAWPIPFSVDDLDIMGDFSRTLFRVHPSVREVTVEDFTCQNQQVADGWTREITVGTDAEGWLTVQLTQTGPQAITLTASDANGKTSFTEGTRWSDRQTPSSGKDYWVTDNLLIRTPDAAATSETTRKFTGRSLTLGGERAYGSLALKFYSSTRGLARTEIEDLRVANSGSSINMACASSTAKPSYVSLYGKITFLSPRASISDLNVPYISGDTSRRLDLYSELVSAPGCGFKVNRGGDNDRFMLVSLMGDNPDFHGSISVVGPERNTGTGLTLTAESSVALGPNPETPTPLLHLCEGGTFGVEYGSVTIDQPNRGILLTTASGGRLYAAAGKTLDTSMFITSESPLRPLVKYGAGDVFVSGACSVGDVTVTEGRLGLSGNVSSKVTVNAGCSFGPAVLSGKLSLSGALVLANATQLCFRGSEATDDVIELKEGFTSSVWPIPFKVDGLPAKGAFKRTLFRVHPSVRTITEADFSCQNAKASADYKRVISIVDDEEGWQLVNMEQSARGVTIYVR